MILDEWIIKQVKHQQNVTFIKFTNANDTEFTVKSEDPPRLEFVESLIALRDIFKTYIANPILNTPGQFIIYAIDFKYKDEELDSVSFTITVVNKDSYQGELKVSNIKYPTESSSMDKAIETIMHEANLYIAGHRAQMGLFDQEGEDE